MRIILDANLAVSLFIRLPYSEQADALIRSWRYQAVELFAPALWPSEIVSAMRKMASIGQISTQDARQAIASCARLPVQIVVPDAYLMDLSLNWAEKIKQIVAYDAQYLALAEVYQADFWTADKRLFTAISQLNVSWGHWIGEQAA